MPLNKRNKKNKKTGRKQYKLINKKFCGELLWKCLSTKAQNTKDNRVKLNDKTNVILNARMKYALLLLTQTKNDKKNNKWISLDKI